MAQTTLSVYKNNLFSNHFLEDRIEDLEEWQEAEVEEKFDKFRELYRERKDILTENLNEDQTQDNFIDPVLRKLGHDWVTEASKRVGSRTDGKNLNPDYAFMDSSNKLKVHRANEDPLDINYAVGDAKAWNKELDRSSQDHTNPAFQIYNYVDRLRADWGILTNGKKWRLYSYEKCAADIYFEVDLENLLSGEKTEEKLEAFKYFYLFFRAESFEEGLLEKVYQQSVEYNESLEDDLEDKVYKALEIAVEGFFDTNNIDKTEENIELVHHSSLIFLYRILFILNAESRDLLPTDDEAYRQAFGLTQLKRMIIDDEGENTLFQDTTVAWDNRLSRLFEGIDDGYELHETEIPAYNGGLFDEDNGKENRFLAENKLYGSYIKEILELLATSYDEEKEQKVILDYKDLNIRHLGSVYEGLLEHKFKAADERKVLRNGEWTNFSEVEKGWEDFEEEKRVEENELYLTNESGERKATGSYYTPEYIVEYIVENTIGPKVEEKITEAEENGDTTLTKILELNVCDPAMGSGHFLTEATSFIAEKIVEHADLENQEIGENEDELNWAKRQVVQNCIYGVDVNELAVELGKLSLWIETMAKGKPLNFLDHHLKHGNSLIGSDFDEIFSHPTEEQKRLDNERYQFGSPEEIKENFQKKYLEIEKMPENTVKQIKEKEEAYEDFRRNNVLYRQFKQLANIHTRQYFEKEANSSDYESLLVQLGNEDNPFEDSDWFQSAQQDSEERNYFHWQLEFPKVFFGEQNGFDAVVGNPPYLNVFNMKSYDKHFFQENYFVTKNKIDLYAFFLERSVGISSDEVGMIISNTWLSTDSFEKLRRFLVENCKIEEIVDLGGGVFEEATVKTLIFRLSVGDFPDYDIRIRDSIEGPERLLPVYYTVKNESNVVNLDLDKDMAKIFDKLETERLGEIAKMSLGIKTANDDKFISQQKDERYSKKIIRGKNIERYYVHDSGEYLWYNPEEMKKKRGARERKSDNFEVAKKIVFQEMGGKDLIAALDNEKRYPLDTANSIFDLNSDYDFTPLVCILNSKIVNLWYGTHYKGVHVKLNEVKNIPLPAANPTNFRELMDLGNKIRSLKKDRGSLNTKIQDYLGNYSEEKTLGDLYSPAEGLSNRILSDTSSERDNLRIGSVEFEEKNGQLILMASARYKPENEDEFETDRWGYTETEMVPAMKFDVDDKMKALIREFVPFAVDEAGGFANFRESATKTNSIIDRLESLTLPKLDDVEQGLEKFIKNKEKAEKLEKEIQETDELIDAIVFDLYDLTEDEVETVLDSLDTPEDEKARILQKFGEVK